MVGAVAGAVILVLVIVALVQVARQPKVDPIVRALWILIIVVAPIAGAIVWFAIGQKTTRLQFSARN
jgi:chromate transport protein ChrA